MIFFFLICLCIATAVAKVTINQSVSAKHTLISKQSKTLQLSGGYASSVNHISDKSVLDKVIADPKNKGKLVVIDFTAKW